MKKLLAIVALSLFLATGPSLAGAALTNGGFESGITGWSVSGTTNYGFDYGVPYEGVKDFWGYCNEGYATLSQTVETTTGTTYDFSFWSRALPAFEYPGKILRYSFDGGSTIFEVNETYDWTQTVTSFTANSDHTDIQFYFETDWDQGSWVIDDVRLAEAAATVPIPAAVWLFGSGLLGLFGVRRKLRK